MAVYVALIVWLLVFLAVCYFVDHYPKCRYSLVWGGIVLVFASIALPLIALNMTDASAAVNATALPEFVTQLTTILGGAVGGSFVAHGLITTNPNKNQV